MEAIKGIAVAPGVVIGPAFVLDDALERVPYGVIAPDRVEAELGRLVEAIEAASSDLELDRDRTAQTLGSEPAKIFEFHLGLLHDPSLIEPVRERIREQHVTASYAVADAFRSLADRFRHMGSEVFRQKASDVIDLDRRLLGKLSGVMHDRLDGIEVPSIVIAHELTPAQAAGIDTETVIGFATDAGGRTSHSSIVAAALGIPVVVGGQRLTQHVRLGDLVIIDGNTGVVIVRPDETTLAEYQRDLERQRGVFAGLLKLAELEPVTLDGVRIHLMGNVEFSREVQSVVANGGDGVGLFRTEFLFLTSHTEPSEDEQFDEYRRALELLDGRPLTIRTLDLGADKYTQERAEERERNPFLGLRSIRYCLQNLPMFRSHLKAILRASAHGPLRIMFPLISTALELRQARMILNDVMEECLDEGIDIDRDIPVGIMIEVPSAALMASVLAREVAFFSIGTNDLIQYTLAVDRGNERVANLYSGANPAVLQLVKAVVRSAKRFNVDTSICGEIAGEPTYTMLLLGLGLRTLSLVPSQIPKVKRVIRSVDMKRCEQLARKVGSFDSERQVLTALRDELQNVMSAAEGGRSAGSASDDS